MLWWDLRQAARALWRNPGTTLIAVFTLGLGLGGNTAAYTWIHALLFSPYPFDDLGALMTVWERHPEGTGNLGHQGRAAGDRNPVAPADYLDLERENRVFSRLAAYQYTDLFLLADGVPERLRGVRAAPDLLATLGVEVALGRGILAADAEPGRDRVVLLSDGFWRRRFGGDPEVLGGEIQLDNEPYTVVGVLPASLHYPLGGVEAWTPLTFPQELANERGRLALFVVGRLAEGAGEAAAQSELERIALRLEEAHPLTNRGRTFIVVPLSEQQVGMLPPFLLLAQGAAAFVLLIACANTTSLLLKRVAQRERELAGRAAVGASRWQLVRLVLLESVGLALMGGIVAAVLASVAAGLIRASLPSSIAKWVGGWNEIGVDAGALAVTLAAACATGLLAGLVPALRASDRGLLSSLTDDSGSGRGGSRRQRFGGMIVVGQLALAVVLSAGAALLVQGFVRLVGTYHTLEPEGVLTLAVRLPESRYPEPHHLAAFHGRLIEELATLPGVEQAAVVSHLPGDQGPIPRTSFVVEGSAPQTAADVPAADLQVVSAGYFDSLRIPLLAGRSLAAADDRDAPGVVVVSASLARRFWPGESAVGRRLRLGDLGADSPWLAVVGVVGDVRQYWFDAAPRPTLYLPYQQAPRRSTFVVLRGEGDPTAIAGATRRRVLGIDASQPIDEVRTMPQVVAEAVAFLRAAAGLTVALAVLASVLAAIGTYALLAHQVAQSTHEVGMRMALGADRRRVIALFVGRAAVLATVGLALGVPAAVALGRILAGALYGVVALDPALLAAAAGLGGAVAVLAGFVPARRAARLDPAAALRR